MTTGHPCPSRSTRKKPFNVRFAWMTCFPDASSPATPGYPWSEHGFAPVFLNRRMTPMWPAAELLADVTLSCAGVHPSADG